MMRFDRITVYIGLFSLLSIFFLWGCVATVQMPRDSGPQHPSQGYSRCDEYARVAVSQNEQNFRRRCGFTGPRWTSDYNAHYQWCLGVQWEAADSESRAREHELQQCGGTRSRCDEYARIAVSQNEQNLRRRCGFTGPRWTSDYNAHYQWCLGVQWEAADSESRAREHELRQCR